MQGFRTTLAAQKALFSIAHSDVLLAIGSCFADHIGSRLQQLKFNLHLNPFGILYNPVSVAQTLASLLDDTVFKEEDLIFQKGLWHSFAHHGQFSNPDKEATLKYINESLQKSREAVQGLKRLIITLGTAHVFEYKKNQAIVANCHKLPGSEFERKRLSVEEVIKSLQPVCEQYKTTFPDLEILFSVSPVRHIRDGLVENQRSKATLLLAITQLSAELDYVSYFPAYELLLDDLRDYRFYDSDMIHPSAMAVDYIWEFFMETYLSEETKSISCQIEKIIKASHHRPIHPQSEGHQQFIQNQLEKVKSLEKKYPFLDLAKEQATFLQQL